MRRKLKCGCDLLANRVYLCEEHAFIIEQLIRMDEGKGMILIEAPRTEQSLMIMEGQIIDAVIIESEIKDETKHES